MKTLLLTCLALVMPWTCFAWPHESAKIRMLNDLEIIRNSFEIKYAPVEWKKNYANIDVDELMRQAKIQVIATDDMQIASFQRVVKRFFQAIGDYHVGVRFYSTAHSSLPFRLQSAQGRYFVVWVDEKSPIQLAVGDEVISFDGEPIHEVVTELKERELSNLNLTTDQALAEIYLTTRLGSLGHTIPSGPVTVITSDLVVHEFEWDHTPEEVTHGPYQHQMSYDLKDTPAVAVTSHQFFAKQMLPAFYSQLVGTGTSMPIGQKLSALPPIGEVIWETEEANPFRAYLFKTIEGRTAGYIRIPSYVGDVSEAKAFAQLITRFEAESDILVIDQLNNPGGFIFYMYALASMLTQDPLIVMTHKMTITQEDACFAIEALKILETMNVEEASKELGFDETLYGYLIDEQLLKTFSTHLKFIVNEWNAGSCFTSPTHLFGIDRIRPHGWGHYSKPILFLVNELDFSCADFLPALLQDNKRAIIMGTKTAGAGGYVLSHAFPNRFGIGDYKFTGSIAERLDGQPIESLGITPDILYELTPKDLSDRYSDYIVAIQAVIGQLLPSLPVPQVQVEAEVEQEAVEQEVVEQKVEAEQNVAEPEAIPEGDANIPFPR